jgi:hypothetical protein
VAGVCGTGAGACIVGLLQCRQYIFCWQEHERALGWSWERLLHTGEKAMRRRGSHRCSSLVLIFLVCNLIEGARESVMSWQVGWWTGAAPGRG